MRYIDDEGDDILVTTTDELQEALRVGKETNNGILSLNLYVTGMGESTRAEIEDTAAHVADESTDDDSPVTENPVRPLRQVVQVVSTTEPDILKILKDAGASAITEINSALGSASAEIDKMFSQLGAASTKQKQTEQQLAQAKVDLVEANSKCTASEQQVTILTQKLADTKTQLDESIEQKKRDSLRLQALESQLATAAEWESKWKVVENQRLQLDQQLQTLRSALKCLSATETAAEPEPKPAAVVAKPAAVVAKPAAVAAKPVTVTAEVVSNEIVPELPPSYESHVGVAKHNEFPMNCPAPTPLQLKRQQQIQQLKDMGFHLTLEQLNEKLQQHGGDLSHVVQSLLWFTYLINKLE